jgi:hypothetical protein
MNPSGREEAEEEEPTLANSPFATRPALLNIIGRNRSSQKTFRRNVDSKVIGLKNFGMDPVEYAMRHQLQQQSVDNAGQQQQSLSSIRATQPRTAEERYVYEDSVEYKEAEIRRKAIKNPYLIFFLGTIAAMKVLIFYLGKSRNYKIVISRYCN